MEKLIVYALIPAAGTGSRMGTDMNKQFLDLSGKPVLARTLLAFENSPLIDKIVIVCKRDEKNLIQKLCREYNIEKLEVIVEGGSTRRDSVHNGLEQINKLLTKEQLHSENVFVLIHDGARPFVSKKLIEKSIKAIKDFGACVCAVQVKNTIKSSDNQMFVQKTLPRENLWSVQTPQGFIFQEILDLQRKAAKEDFEFTDDSSVAEYFGRKVKIITGDYENIKITTEDDLALSELFLIQKNINF